MARYNVENVLDRLWNDSGSEESISDSDHTTGNSNSDSESEEWSGDSAETSESSDTESVNESEESDNEPVAGNNSNPRGRRVQPRQDKITYTCCQQAPLCTFLMFFKVIFWICVSIYCAVFLQQF